MNTNQTFKRNDNIYQDVRLVDIRTEYNIPTRPGIDKFVEVGGEVVHVASAKYGFIPNQKLYGKLDAALDDVGIQYSKRATNNNNRTFAVDYILEDKNFHVNINSKHADQQKADLFKPMIRVINSYDGTQKNCRIVRDISQGLRKWLARNRDEH